jgi:threonine dehydrogenase-like Zn-dependent dehydrogenase
MSRKRSVMKPITDPWCRYCRTNRENLCTFSGIVIGFSQVRD